MSSPATTAKVAVVVAPPEVLEVTVAPLEVLEATTAGCCCGRRSRVRRPQSPRGGQAGPPTVARHGLRLRAVGAVRGLHRRAW